MPGSLRQKVLRISAAHALESSERNGGSRITQGSPEFMVWHANADLFYINTCRQQPERKTQSVKISTNEEGPVERSSFHSTDPQLFASLLPFVVFVLDEIAVT